MSARWAILGAGAISGDFAVALPHAELGHLHAVGARDDDRAQAFADTHGAAVAGETYDILERDDVDAVYIGTVHTTHAELAIAALEAGKAVLCEKPLAVTPAETEAVLAAAAAAGLPLVEAFKYRFGPFADRLRSIIAGGELGEITEVTTVLGFRAAERAGRLFDPATAGGGILDVGCYPVSLVALLADGVGRLDDLTIAGADGIMGPTGVDEHARAVLRFGDATARIETALDENLTRATVIRGTAGTLEIPNVWASRTLSTDAATLTRADGTVVEITVPTVASMAAEADATIAALGDGRIEVPEMPWSHTRTVARLLDDWLTAVRGS